MKLLCGMQVRNEARMLPGALAHLRGYVDGFVILDDGSTDETSAILRAEPKMLAVLDNPARDETAHVWDEPANRQRVLRAAKDLGAEWMLVCDPDERFERTFLRMLKVLAATSGDTAFFDVRLRELWNEPDQYRVDPPWGDAWRRVLFTMPSELSFREHRPLHGPWAPDAVLASPGARLDFSGYHFGSLSPSERASRRDKYNLLDPERRHTTLGYDYLADERGLVLERIPAGKEYDFASLPADLLAAWQRR